MAFLYVASPYTDPDPDVMHQRYLAVQRYCAHALHNLKTVFSPIMHCHPMACLHSMPRHFEFWQLHDKEMIHASSGLEVLALPGWRDSRGVQWEIKYAESMSIPVITIPDDHPWLQKDLLPTA